MRIISGKARGRRLAEFSGHDIRPTPDRVREALFSILTSRLNGFTDLKILELFAGSGAQSLEAISRGASQATLVDSGTSAAKLILDNLQRCRFECQVSFIQQDVFKALPTLTTKAPFDLIFLDPPYKKNLIPEAIELIMKHNLLAEDGLICAETEKSEALEGIDDTLELIDDRNYGTTRVRLYQPAGA